MNAEVKQNTGESTMTAKETAANELALQQKKEASAPAERTEAARFYSPYTDIYELADRVVVVMEMPGVDKSALDVTLEKNVLTVTGSIDSKAYEELQPIYTEYNVGNFSRTFTLSTQIDSSKISATIEDGVLKIDLPKAGEAVARRIEVH